MNRNQWPMLLSGVFAAALVVAALVVGGCGPRVYRGGEGTDRPDIDDPPMSLVLDRVDIDYLVEENFEALENSRFWRDVVRRAQERPLMAVWPIQNHTTMHLEDQMDALLMSVETRIVNTGDARVVARSRQEELARELQYRQIDIFDRETAGELGRQLGAEYFVTGRLTGVDERLQKTRRLQYRLFMQILHVETGEVMFQNEAMRTKMIRQ